jgi:hypothetical protein
MNPKFIWRCIIKFCIFFPKNNTVIYMLLWRGVVGAGATLGVVGAGATLGVVGAGATLGVVVDATS